MSAPAQPRRWIDWALAWLMLAAPMAILWATILAEAPGRYRLVADASATPGGVAQLFIDYGAGFSETDSVTAPVVPTLTRVSFPLRAGDVVALRLDPNAASGAYAWSNLRIERDGQPIHAFAPEDVRAANGIASLVATGKGVRIVAVPAGSDPQLSLALAAPQRLEALSVFDLLVMLAGAGALAAAAIWLAVVSARQLRTRFGAKIIAAPRVAVAAVAAIVVGAAVLSVYPLLFGQSLAAPNLGPTPLVYEYPPYWPGASATDPPELARMHPLGPTSDVGAMAWQNQPWSVTQHRAVFGAGEAPLWNRYNNLGVPLLGQGASGAGDPLHWVAIAAGGAAWAWDLKFLFAKMLLALGVAALVLMVTGSRRAAAAIGVSCCFIGLFYFRLNHPSQFTYCYGPWLLVAWLWLARAEGVRSIAGALALMACASGFVLNGGGLKEATISLAVLHLTGALALAFDTRPRPRRVARLIAAAVAGIAFLALTAPMTLAFAETLRESVTGYDKPYAEQLPLWRIGGLFEDFIYLIVRPQSYPTLNLALGFCAVWALVDPVALWRNTTLRALLIGCGVCALLMYGFLPQGLLLSTPLLRNIYHLPNSFSFPLTVLLAVIAGAGLAQMLSAAKDAAWRIRCLKASALIVALIAVAVVGDFAQWRHADRRVLAEAVLTIALTLAAPWALWIGARHARLAPAAACALVVALGAVHARNGLQLRTGAAIVDDAAINLGARPDYEDLSFGLAALVAAQEQEPSRVLGVNAMLFPGSGALSHVEMVAGPDPLRSRRYEDLLAAVGWPRAETWDKRLTADEIGALGPVLDMLNVRHLVTRAGEGARWQGAPVFSADVDIVERTSAWPRAFFTTDVGVFRSAGDVAARLKSASSPFALLPESVASPPNAAPAVVAARNYALGPSTTAFDITAPVAGVVVLTENYYAGVRVTVDGAERPVFPVNGAFRGVIVPAGEHRIAFAFRPDYAGPIKWVFHAAALALLAVAVGLALWLERRLTL